jgi:phosphatidylglycerophosphatase C
MNRTAQDVAHWLVLYDFDGTITRTDSMIPYLIYTIGAGRFARGLPAVAARCWRLWRQGRLSRAVGKEVLTAYFLAGWSRAALEAADEAYAAAVLPRLVRPAVLAQLRAYRAAGATVAVVSASMDLWLRAFCRREGLGLLCTEAEIHDDRYTGRLATPNCKYAEKARRVRAAYDPDAYARVVAYGNSRGDEALFALADEAWRCNIWGRFRRV